MKNQEKSWMDNDLMKVWLKDIWIKHIRVECQKLGFPNALLTFDAFAARLTDDVENQLWKQKPTPWQFQLVVPQSAKRWMFF